MASKESLKAKRHELYCSIADALQDSCAEGQQQQPDLLGRLQAVLEAEARLSHVNGDVGGGDSTIDSSTGIPAESGACAAVAAPMRVEDDTPAAAAVSALHQLRDELAQHTHQSVQQQPQQQKPRQVRVVYNSCAQLTT
jgi:hypothetical protein